MPYTGTPTVAALGKLTARITGISIPSGATCVLGLPGDSAADIQLPATFPIQAGVGEDMTDVVDVDFLATTAGVAPMQVSVDESNENGWRASLVNDDAENESPELEIYVTYAHTMSR